MTIRLRGALPRVALALASLALLAGAPRAARADERFFTYTYEPKVLPDGGMEFEQSATVRQGKQDGQFTRWDLRTELEVGLLDVLSSSIYLNYSSIQSDAVHGMEDQDRFHFDGISNEWRWKLTDPVADPLGTLLYFEWLYQGQAAELEEKLVLGKEIGAVVLATNLVFEEEWAWDSSGTTRELEVHLTGGVSYRFNPHISLGLEFDERNDLPNYGRWEDSVLYLGPALHVAWGRAWATLTVLPQIVAWRGATYGKLDLDDDHERVEARLLVSVEF